MNQTQDDFSRLLLDWYNRHARTMPWRVSPKDRSLSVKPDPYRVWLSEIMLQQTQVTTVKAYFEKFISLWPNVKAMAAADEEDILKAWAGLGYYSRARNLKRCADQVVSQHAGEFPHSAAELKLLPGIGDYTSAAIAAIVHDEPIAVVDGNVERVFARLLRIDTPLPKAKEIVRSECAKRLPTHRSGDFAQALMDLGATICTPKNPACSLCPVNELCEAETSGDMLAFPVKAPKKKKPIRKGAVFVAINNESSVLLERRGDTGLLAGMTQIPTTHWSASTDGATGAGAAPFEALWQHAGTVRHTFTHFHLELDVWRACEPGIEPGPGQWLSPVEKISGEALPNLMRKALELALPGSMKPAKPNS